MENSSIKVWILGILCLAVFIVGGSFLYSKVAKNPLSPAVSLPSLQQTTDTPGFKTAQQMLTDYPQFVKRTFVQQQIEGTLKASNRNSWTLEAGGKTLVVTNQGDNKFRYTKLPKTASNSAQAVSPVEIKPADIKTGDLVLISQIIDWQTGQTTIVGITVLPPK